MGASQAYPWRELSGENSAFVLRLQDYGALQVQRFLDIDWARIAVTKEIVSSPRKQKWGPCTPGGGPLPPSDMAKPRNSSSSGMEGCPEGRGVEAFGSTLADYIFTEISVRASTCGDDAHYKAIDNGLWYLLGKFAEPPSSHTYPCLPPGTGQGRNQTGNVYEALVGPYWLAGQTQALVDLFLTLMDLDQIEYA